MSLFVALFCCLFVRFLFCFSLILFYLSYEKYVQNPPAAEISHPLIFPTYNCFRSPLCLQTHRHRCYKRGPLSFLFICSAEFVALLIIRTLFYLEFVYSTLIAVSIPYIWRLWRNATQSLLFAVTFWKLQVFLKQWLCFHLVEVITSFDWFSHDGEGCFPWKWPEEKNKLPAKEVFAISRTHNLPVDCRRSGCILAMCYILAAWHFILLSACQSILLRGKIKSATPENWCDVGTRWVNSFVYGPPYALHSEKYLRLENTIKYIYIVRILLCLRPY